MKTILVAGGAGFIGSNFVKYMLNTDSTLYFLIVDNMITGETSNLPISNNVSFIKEDISKPDFIQKIILKYKEISQIWNFACPASPKMYRRYPLETIDACTSGVKNLCELAVFYNAQLVHASTSEVYGETLDDMVETNPGVVHCFGPRSCYDEGKRMAETIMLEYMNKHKMCGCICRLFNTYGPGMKINDGRVIPNFITRMIHSDDIYIYGSVTKTRSFCYITDTIEGMLKIAQSYHYLPINIGTTNEISLVDLANMLKETMHEMGVSSNTCIKKVQKGPTHDPDMRKPNINAALALGYSPKVSLKSGLKMTISYFIDILTNGEYWEQIYQTMDDDDFSKAYDELKIDIL